VEPRLAIAPRPEPERKRQLVLAVGLDGALASGLAPVLDRDEFEVRHVADPPQATRLADRVRFDAVLVARADGEDELLDLLHAIRRPEAASWRASLALFLPADEMPLARAYQSAGADQVLPRALNSADQQAVVLRLLRSKVRVEARVMARLAVRLESGVSQRLCQTRDLSRTGMFVHTSEWFPVGSPVQFALELGDAGVRVRGEGVVVRCVVESARQPEGVGIEFHSLAGDGAARLDVFLDRLRA
jgi:DNA-binding NarL/FixJ family response regulator